MIQASSILTFVTVAGSTPASGSIPDASSPEDTTNQLFFLPFSFFAGLSLSAVAEGESNLLAHSVSF